MVTIKEYLQRLGYATVPDDTYRHIAEWERWYAGEVKDFHRYKVFNGIRKTTKTRERLNMAKTVCEDWASLIMNEKVIIHTGGEFDAILKQVFEYNNFRVKGNQLIELAFALGTGAFVEYLDAAGEVVIDYIRAGMIYPISWENGYVTECAFGSVRGGEKKQIYLQIHRLNEEKCYVIENHMADAESGEELNLPEDMQAEVITKSAEPLFQLVAPNIINNIDLDSPMGISVFGNAISQLKGCDLIYDSYLNEYAIGRRRIIVPLGMAKIELGANGEQTPVFDSGDTAFYAVPDNRGNPQKIEAMDMSIRAQEHEIGINKALDMLSFKCGLGAGRYKFESGAVKTATEVISEKSDLYQNLKKHEIVVEAALKGMIRAIAFLRNEEVGEMQIDFDDSVIEDKQTERTVDKGDVAMGVMRLEEYRAKWYGETEAVAAQKLPVPTELDMEEVGE